MMRSILHLRALSIHPCRWGRIRALSKLPQTFSDLPLPAKLKRNLPSFSHLTDIQSQTFQPAFEGRDVIGKARTGTGKTLAFLLPSLSRLPKESRDTRMLLVAPTRELAQQCHSQIQRLTRKPALLLVGGRPKVDDVDRLTKWTPVIVTATPGRLLDHLESGYLKLDTVEILVLDEMDRLLGMGFREEITKILQYLPPERQTLLFSATLPKQVSEMIETCIKPDHVLIDCIGEVADHSATDVDQSYGILPPARMVSGVLQVLFKLMTIPRHKVIVFFSTSAQVDFYFRLLKKLHRPVLAIHAQKRDRTKVSQRFRKDRRAILLSTDVSARGVDYPNVTHVVQVGVAESREAYIHRVGRTGRAGKTGKSLLLLLEAERKFLERDLHGLDVSWNKEIQGLLEGELDAELETSLLQTATDIRLGEARDLVESAHGAYHSLLGFYHSRFASLGIRDQDLLVSTVNDFAASAGLYELPPVASEVVSRYKLERHRGLNVRTQWKVGTTFNVGSPSNLLEALNDAEQSSGNRDR